MSIYDNAVRKPTATVAPISNGNRTIYANGVSKSVMKRIAGFWFGESNVLTISAIENNKNFLLVVSEKVEPWQISQFSEYWKVKVKQTN